MTEGLFGVHPLTYFHLPKSARAHLFSQSVEIRYPCSGPISVDPIRPQPRYLDVFGSIFAVMQKLKEEGYTIEDLFCVLLFLFFSRLRESYSEVPRIVCRSPLLLYSLEHTSRTRPRQVGRTQKRQPGDSKRATHMCKYA